MKQIHLTRGLVAIVDDVDYEGLSRFKWCAQESEPGRFYAVRRKASRLVYMHKELMPGVPLVDHWNGCSLDNRRFNLRPCTQSQNNQNSRPQNGCSSQFKGVSWSKAKMRWRAYVNDGRQIHLGYFDSEEAAAHAYNEAAQLHFGEFARPNVLQPLAVAA